jgi:tripartite-type tricarboxylate transporter receptor subunit TctC
MAGINIPHIILQPLQQEVGYKTEQIVPVSLFQRTILALAVLNTSQFKTLEEFIDYAKKNPGALTAGGSGTFSGPHMASLRFEKLASAKITYVPFTGAAPQTMAFLGGHTAAAFGNSDDLVRYKDKVRVLAFASEAGFPMAPMVLATVLAQMLETSLQQSLLISRGSPCSRSFEASGWRCDPAPLR